MVQQLRAHISSTQYTQHTARSTSAAVASSPRQPHLMEAFRRELSYYQPPSCVCVRVCVCACVLQCPAPVIPLPPPVLRLPPPARRPCATVICACHRPLTRASAAARSRPSSSSVSLGFTDYSQVGMLGVWCKLSDVARKTARG